MQRGREDYEATPEYNSTVHVTYTVLISVHGTITVPVHVTYTVLYIIQIQYCTLYKYSTVHYTNTVLYRHFKIPYLERHINIVYSCRVQSSSI